MVDNEKIGITSFAETVDRTITLEHMNKMRGRRKWKRYGEDVIPFWYSSPDYPVPQEVKDAAAQAIEDECFEYSWFPETLEAMAETTRTKYQIDSTVDDIKVIPGVEPSLYLSTMYACKPGD